MTTQKKPRKTTVKRASTPIPDLPPNPFTFEVFDIVSKQRSAAKKVEALKKFEHDSLKALFIWNFDESVISLLPPGEVPYSSMKDEQNNTGTLTTRIGQQVNTLAHNQTTHVNEGHTTLRREWTKLYNFIKGGNDKLNGLRRETMFINILTGLHPLDAEILCLVKDKKLSDKYKITRANVETAYPDIQWGNRS
tara:strand:+ start:176 stop:754 length:579 start_codon:yes stop_codon:yes gene_type:complete